MSDSSFACDVCEKSYTTKSNLKQHKQKKHAEEIDIVSYDCAKCDKNFATEKELKEHQSRKRKNRIVGCDGKKAGSSTVSDLFPDVSLSSIISETPSVDDVQDEDLVFEHNREKGCEEMAVDGIELEWNKLAFQLKKKNDILVMGDSEEEDGETRETPKTPGYMLGAQEGIVKSVKTHPDFNTQVADKSAVGRVIKSRKKRDKMLLDIVVKADQSNAIHTHKDEGVTCPPDCTYLKRRLALHKQQVLLGLVVIQELKITRQIWISFIGEHLRMLKRNDWVHFGDFQEFLRIKFSGTAADVVSHLEVEVGGQPDQDQQQHLPAPGVPAAVPGPPLEISVASIQKGEKRLKRREETRKKRKNGP